MLDALLFVATFESIGVYWKPPSDPGPGGCPVRYRKKDESAWKEGLPLWYDARNGECRGSLVQLAPGTQYEIEVGGKQIVAATWSEKFPIAKTVKPVPQEIKEGGSKDGYVLYDGTGQTIEGGKFNVTISAPYVILRGMTLKGAEQDAIRLLEGAHDVVIEDNDISGWGRMNYVNSKGWQVGVDMESGIRADCRKFPGKIERVIIQRNRIHDPRYGANSWSWGHPAGPQGVTISYCGGNHVIRYNEVTSSPGHYFNDGIGGEDNFSDTGFPNADSDIYGNIVTHTWDDAIEAEGGNRNVRIWGNYLDETATGVATTVTHWGPVYIFRNVYNRSRMRYFSSYDADDRGPFFKSGTDLSVGNGRRYIFHNTSLQPTQSGSSYGLGAGSGTHGSSTDPMTNTVSRNNIYWIWKSGWDSIDQTSSGFGNDANNDLYNGSINAGAGAESAGFKVSAPSFASGNGVGMSGMYQLAPGTPGYGTGARIPNFNDQSATPDIGAHQSGAPAMTFGVNGRR